MTADLTHRLLFPEDRTAFVYGEPGEPIRTPFRTGLQLFADEPGTVLADVVDEQGTAIEHSTIYTGEDSLLPLFYGPPDWHTLVWAKVVGGGPQAYPLVAQYGAQLAQVPTLEHGNGPPLDSTGVAGSSYIDDLNHVLYGPKTSVWPTPGFSLRGEQGPPGANYEYAQLQPAAIWVISHPLTFRPNVTVVDSAGFEVLGDVSYPFPNQVVIEFSSQLGGIALLS